MGQKIEVTATRIDSVALFDLDRSLTGQDGIVFRHPPPDSAGPPALLAQRLFADIEDVETVYVLSNTVSVSRTTNWDDDTLAGATEIVRNLFVFYPEESLEDRVERLRAENYNATISSIRVQNPDLWIIYVRPDEPIEPFKAGQYTTLGLGFWEPRADDAMEDFDANPEQWGKMARRSYSVSSSIVDEKGELVEAHPEDVEFYIVRVPPEQDELPALTPRIFLKGEGDRIYMSHKFTGRYTLDGVQPTDKVVFLSTGTGEAPNNAMIAELLRTGHEGKILSVVCVRYRSDLSYTKEQEVIEERYPNYKYVTLTTREPENLDNKVYIQDLILSGRLEEELGESLDPADTHVYLCGNPSMIGLPTWDDKGNMEFPETLGVCQILSERGFTIDHRRTRGNVHFEEYW